MPIYIFLAIIVLLGVIGWFVPAYVPMNSTVKKVFIFVIVALAILLILVQTGIWAEVKSIDVPKL